MCRRMNWLLIFITLMLINKPALCVSNLVIATFSKPNIVPYLVTTHFTWLQRTFLQATAETASHLLLTLIRDTAQRSYVPVAAISLVIMWVRIYTLHKLHFSRLCRLDLSVLMLKRLPIPPPHIGTARFELTRAGFLFRTLQICTALPSHHCAMVACPFGYIPLINKSVFTSK